MSAFIAKEQLEAQQKRVAVILGFYKSRASHSLVIMSQTSKPDVVFTNRIKYSHCTKQEAWCKDMLKSLSDHLTWENLDQAWEDFQEKYPRAPK